jgi:ribosomal protein S18 acetylase RimI-like enzyme
VSTELVVARGFSDALRPQAASLYDAAFGAKLSIAIPGATTRLSLLEQAFDPSHCFVALADGKVVGIAGFRTATGALTAGITLARLYASLRPLAALRAAFVMALFKRRFRGSQLLLDGISVAPEARGSGIGTKLLDRLKDFAAQEGYATIRLDVIDTNPAARRLYERLGFTPTKTERFGHLRWLLGFSAATTLEYCVSTDYRV